MSNQNIKWFSDDELELLHKKFNIKSVNETPWLLSKEERDKIFESCVLKSIH